MTRRLVRGRNSWRGRSTSRSFGRPMLPRPANGVTASLAWLIALSVLAVTVGLQLPASNQVIAALLLGAAVSNIGLIRELDHQVSEFVFRRLLRLCVVLLGAGISFSEIQALGVRLPLLIACCAATAFVVAHFGGQRLGLDFEVRVLLAVGTAICGASAIAVAAPILRARAEQIGVALGTIVAMNGLVLLILPVMGRSLDLSAPDFGMWAGLAVHDTASAIATGLSLGADAGDMSTVTKLLRIPFLLPILLLITFMQARRAATVPVPAWRTAFDVIRSMPAFLLGFAVMVSLNSSGLLGVAAAPMKASGQFLLVPVVVAIGISLRVGELKSLSPGVLVTGFATTLAVVVLSFGLVLAT